MPSLELVKTDRLEAALKLRQYYQPNTVIAGGRECISFPFPDNNGGVSILIREKDNPTILRQVGIPESDWL
jgi:hypothetical protein